MDDTRDGIQSKPLLYICGPRTKDWTPDENDKRESLQRFDVSQILELY